MMKMMKRTVSTAATTPALLLLLLLSALSYVNAGLYSQYVPSAFQSGPDEDGNTFVSSAVYSTVDNSVILTGSTWGNYFDKDEAEDDDATNENDDNSVLGCFLAVASLPDEKNGHPQQQELLQNPTPVTLTTKLKLNQLKWKEQIAKQTSNEVCNALHLYNNNQDLLIAAHGDGDTTSNSNSKNEERRQDGLLIDVEWKLKGDHTFALHGGSSFQRRDELYPVAMANMPFDESNVFVLYLKGDREFKTEEEYLPSEHFDYGAGFGFTTVMYSWVPDQIAEDKEVLYMEQKWTAGFTPDNKDAAVYMTDLVAVGDQHRIVLVAGNTNGYGDAFGYPSHVSPKTTSQKVDSNDFDGFITKINLEGEPHAGREGNDPIANRFFTPKKKMDWISGLCMAPENIDHLHVYVVGYTQGRFDGYTPNTSYEKVKQPHDTEGEETTAFIMKLEVASLEPIWIRQLGAMTNPHVKGMVCTVTPDGHSVWMGGVVEEDGFIEESGLTKSNGGKDIFISRYSTVNGKMEFVHQIGSDQDDELAVRNGLVTDNDGNVIVIGNTYGSMYRQRSATEQHSDVVIMTINRVTGELVAPLNRKSIGDFLLPYGFDLSKIPEIHSVEDAKQNSTFIVLVILITVFVTWACMSVCCRPKKRKTDREMQSLKGASSNSSGQWSSSFTSGSTYGDLDRFGGSTTQRRRVAEISAYDHLRVV